MRGAPKRDKNRNSSTPEYSRARTNLSVDAPKLTSHQQALLPFRPVEERQLASSQQQRILSTNSTEKKRGAEGDVLAPAVYWCVSKMKAKVRPRRRTTTFSICSAAGHAAVASLAWSTLGGDDETADVTTTSPLPPASTPKGRHHRAKRKIRFFEGDDKEGGAPRIKKKQLADDDVEDSSILRDIQSAEPSARRRIFNDDEDGIAVPLREDVPGSLSITRRHTDELTVIEIPSLAERNPESIELLRWRLSRTELRTPDASNHSSIRDKQDVFTILTHCNEHVNSEDREVNIDLLQDAIQEGILELEVKIASSSDFNAATVSIRLCPDGIDQMSLPPVPVPRKLPGSFPHRMTKSHPSFTLLRALGTIYGNTIFADRWSSLQSRGKKPEDAITASMIYNKVDNAHSKDFEGPLRAQPLAIPGLVPTLRPYQDAAVRWMLKREAGEGLANDEWELCWFVIVEHPAHSPDRIKNEPYTRSNLLWLPDWKNAKSPPDERHVFCNPFAGWVATKYDEAKTYTCGHHTDVSISRGGILAESMGLGKTVEVIALILANSSPLALHTTPPSFSTSGNGGTTEATTTNVSKARPTSHHDMKFKPIPDGEMCICGRNTAYMDCLSCVSCATCGIFMHGRCAGFRSEAELRANTQDGKCSSMYCVSCPGDGLIPSRATLIICPPAIANQWQREIARHTLVSNEPLKVLFYPGVKELARTNTRMPHKDFHLVHPHILADADVIVTTFPTLMAELGHSDDNPFAGRRKKYVVVPSPLTRIKWWRVCIDEAQKVDAPTAKSARMARKLNTDRRWAVSGTPVSKGKVDDLYGLLLFLASNPFCEKAWFSNSFILSEGDAMKRLGHCLKDVLWRSTKENSAVCEQMGIPEQEEKKVILSFSSIEKHFYEKQFEEARQAFVTYGSSDRLSSLLQRLRAACCHPQIGSGGISGGRRIQRQEGSSLVLSMGQILQKMIDDVIVKCEEAQRIAILHILGQAGLAKLRGDAAGESSSAAQCLRESLAMYEEVIRLADSNAARSEVSGEVRVEGSKGFRGRLSSNLLDWQLRSGQTNDLWANLSLPGSARSLRALKVKAIIAPPLDLSALVMRPKDCVLQASIPGGFVDVAEFSVAGDGSETSLNDLQTRKAKVWRVLIKSFHGSVPTTQHSSPDGFGRVYVGLELRLFEPEISSDSLPRLSALHNGSFVCHQLLRKDKDNHELKAKLQRMEKKALYLHDEYMAHAKSIHLSRKQQLTLAVEARQKCEAEVKRMAKGSQLSWWQDLLAWLTIYGSEEEKSSMLICAQEALGNASNLGSAWAQAFNNDQMLVRKTPYPQFNTIDGLGVSLGIRVQQGHDELGLESHASQEKCVCKVVNLSHNPTDQEVSLNSQCGRCREDWGAQGPVCVRIHWFDCVLCLLRYLSHYDIYCAQAHCYLDDDLQKHLKLSNDPEMSQMHRAMKKGLDTLARSQAGNHYLVELRQRAAIEGNLQDLKRNEIKLSKIMWQAHFDLLSDLDELNMSKQAMRLQGENEDITILSPNERAFVVHRDNIAAESMQHEAKQVSALGDLRRNKHTLMYLKNLANGAEESNCAICLAPLGSERSVLPCAHSFHPDCVDSLFRRSGGISICCPLRCTRSIKREDILLASNKSTGDGSQARRHIIGNWGVKVNALISDVLDIVHLGDKGVIFTQWDDMLDIVGAGLEQNEVTYVRPRSGKSFGEDVRLFRTGEYPVLLLNVKNGAEGLTLTEANHIFLIEPIMNYGVDAQAINR